MLWGAVEYNFGTDMRLFNGSTPVYSNPATEEESRRLWSVVPPFQLGAVTIAGLIQSKELELPTNCKGGLVV